MDLRKLKDKATEAFTKGKFSRAAEFYEEYCEKDPRDQQAKLRMGDAFAKSGNKAKAIHSYTRAAEGFAKEGFLPRAIAASKLILELDPSHKGVQQMLADLYARKTGKPPPGPKTAAPSAGASAVATAMQTPSPFNRKDAIDLPADTSGTAGDNGGFTSAADRNVDSAPSPMNRRDAIELPADDAPADEFVELKVPEQPPLPPAKPLEVARPPLAAVEEIAIEMGPSAPAEAVAAVEIVEESTATTGNKGKVFDLSLDDSGDLDLSSELPPELQVGMTPTPASAAKPSEPSLEFDAPHRPRYAVGEEGSGVELEFEFNSPPADPPPSPAEPSAAPVAPKHSRIWLPTSTDDSVPEHTPSRAALSYSATPTNRKTRTDIENTLEVFSRFEELDAEPVRPAAPPPPARTGQQPRPPPVAAAAAAATPPSIPPAVAALAPPAGKPSPRKPERRLSFTELELEGDSLLHAVETAAQVGASQRGEQTQSDEDVGFSLDDGSAENALPAGELPKIPLFSDLEPEAFMELFERCPLRRFTLGDGIFEQGSIGDSFFVICAGQVKVFRMDGGQRRELATLKEGTFFGEMALLSGSPRTASVEAADEETQLLEISAPILTELSHRYPPVAQALKKFMRQRLLANVMNSSALFQPFSKGDRRMLVEKFRARDVQKGDVIVREGERSDGLYVLLSGEVEVKKGPQLLARLKEGEVFGEMSMLQKTPAIATVQASKRTSLLRLPREHFDAIILTHPQILMLISDLTDARRRETEALLAGEMKLGDDGLMLV